MIHRLQSGTDGPVIPGWLTSFIINAAKPDHGLNLDHGPSSTIRIKARYYRKGSSDSISSSYTTHYSFRSMKEIEKLKFP